MGIQTINLVADPYPPYQYYKGQKIVGLDYYLIQAAFRVKGFEIQTHLHSWDKCIAIMDRGQADGLFQIQPTKEREKSFLFSEVLRTAQTVFLHNTVEPIELINLKSAEMILKKNTLGLVKGYSYSPEIDNSSHSNKVFFES